MTQFIPGEILCEPGSLTINAGRPLQQLTVTNIGDRPIQVGSHYHFFEVNRSLRFDRSHAFGFRLDIPAGTAVRFEPGDTKVVTLTAIAGNRFVYGLNNLVNGLLDAPDAKTAAVETMQTQGYGSVAETGNGD